MVRGASRQRNGLYRRFHTQQIIMGTKEMLIAVLNLAWRRLLVTYLGSENKNCHGLKVPE